MVSGSFLPCAFPAQRRLADAGPETPLALTTFLRHSIQNPDQLFSATPPHSSMGSSSYGVTIGLIQRQSIRSHHRKPSPQLSSFIRLTFSSTSKAGQIHNGGETCGLRFVRSCWGYTQTSRQIHVTKRPRVQLSVSLAMKLTWRPRSLEPVWGFLFNPHFCRRQFRKRRGK